MSFAKPGPFFTGVAAALLVAAILASAGSPPPAAAAERQLTEEQRAHMEERLARVRERLDLSDTQQAQLEDVLRRNFDRRAEVLERHGVTEERTERLKPREARAVKRELETVRQQTDKEVAQILDEGQMAEYRKFQEEAREKVRERMRERRSQQ